MLIFLTGKPPPFKAGSFTKIALTHFLKLKS
jgi:hypothetical protein